MPADGVGQKGYREEAPRRTVEGRTDRGQQEEAGVRPGTIIFVEIPVRDLERSANFYASLFGWTFEEDPSNPHRWLFTPSGAGAMGRITNERPVGPGGARLSIAVDDVPTTAKRAIELGGAPVAQIVGDVGNGVEIVDPDGNHLWAFHSSLSSSYVKAMGSGVE
jgi:predicted enzyme related to lactoylglutathione lyase